MNEMIMMNGLATLFMSILIILDIVTVIEGAKTSRYLEFLWCMTMTLGLLTLHKLGYIVIYFLI